MAKNEVYTEKHVAMVYSKVGLEKQLAIIKETRRGCQETAVIEKHLAIAENRAVI